VSRFNKVGELIIVPDRILIVDDDEFNIFTVKGIIKKHFSVIMDEAYNGEQAVQKVLQTGPNNYYKLIFMDCNMPKMNGF
jgi:two-component system sensor histidine kinase/response regulator